MILLVCLWQHGPVRTLGAILVWPVLHYAMDFCLRYVTRPDHVPRCGCNQTPRNVQGCELGLTTSVRAILTFLHSLFFSFIALALLLGSRFDIEAHSLTQMSSFSFYAYSIYWNLTDWINYCPKDIKRNPIFGISRYHRKTVTMRLLASIFSFAVVGSGIRVVNREMTQWSSAVIPVLLDMQPSSSWKNPSPTQRRTLAYHLLSKSSSQSWYFTMLIIMTEMPATFFNLITLLRMQEARKDFRASTWTRSGCDRTNAEMAAALGAAAWRRERGGQTGIAYQEIPPPTSMESFLHTIHLILFTLLRVICGFMMLRRLLADVDIVQDTVVMCVLLLNYGMGLYQFGGVLSYATKNMVCCDYRYPRRSISWRLLTCCNDEWLR